MEQRVWNTCRQSLDHDKPLSVQSLIPIRSLIVNPHTSDFTISSLLQTITRSLRLTSDPLLLHLPLKLLSDLASLRPHLSPLILDAVRSISLLSADTLAALVSVSDPRRSSKFELDDGVFVSLCFGDSLPARLWLLRNAAERLSVSRSVLLTLFLGFTKDPYPYVREAALDGLVGLCKHGGVEDGGVIEGCYYRAVELLSDAEDCVRSAAIRAVSEWGRLLAATSQEKDKMDWSDAVFLQLCAMVRDMSVGVRIEAFDSLRMIQMVSEEILLQTLSKKVLRIMKEKKNCGHCTAGKFEILVSSAAGAFVHGLEDEFSEVRKVACYSLRMLSSISADFAGQAVNLLMDMLNDDSMVVRLEALETLYHMATLDSLKVQEIHRHMFLGSLIDNNDRIRSAARKIFKAAKLPNWESFRLSIDSLLENLERYPQDEAGVFSVMFGMGQRHGNFAARIIQEVSHEIEPVSEEKLRLDSARVAAFLVLAISVPLSHNEKGQSIPPRLFSYAVTLLGRISHALNDIVDQSTLLAYLCQCSRSSSPSTEVGVEESFPVVNDDLQSSIHIKGNFELPTLQTGEETSEVQSLISCQSKDILTAPVEYQLEEHDEVMMIMNFILAKVKGIWELAKSSCTHEALRSLRACKKELAMFSPTSLEFAGALAFMLYYIHVVKLLTKIWERMVLKVQSVEITHLEILLSKLDRKLREMRCRFTGFSKEEELHILELIIIARILRVSKFEICCHLETLKKLSATMSHVDRLHKEGSIVLSNFIIEVKKTLNDIGNSEGAISCRSLSFAKVVNLFSLEQFNLCRRVRQIHAELNVLDNDSANPLPFAPGLPVAIQLAITLHNVSSQNRLWLTLKMNGRSTQFVFIDFDRLGGCGEVKKFPFVATFYRTPKAGSFTLRVCIGMESMSEDAHWVKSYGGPKHALVDLCQEKEVYLGI